MTPEQCKAARAALRWTAATLAEKSSLSAGTVINFELGHSKSRAGVALLRNALEQAGIKFGHNSIAWTHLPPVRT